MIDFSAFLADFSGNPVLERGCGDFEELVFLPHGRVNKGKRKGVGYKQLRAGLLG
jgi:hypothetical protein